MAYPYNPNPYAQPPQMVPPPVVPNMNDFVYEIAVPPSPSGSPPGRGGAKSPYIQYGSDDKSYYDDRSRLAVGRSSSTKERRAASVHVGDSRDKRDRSRPRSTYYSGGGRYEDEYRGRADKVYYGRGDYYPESNYSASSGGSRENSRERYRHRRSPSTHSEYDYPPYPAGPAGPAGPAPWGQIPPPPPQIAHPGMAMTLANPMAPPQHHPGQALMAPGSMVPWQQPISPETEEMTKKIEALQLQLKKSQEESEKIQKDKEAAEAARKKEEDLKAAVQKHIADMEAAKRKAEEEAAAEAARIKAEAEKLLQQQKAAEEARKKAEEDEKNKIETIIATRMQAIQQVDNRKPTHTKFSKTHLCKEALDEKGVSYTENEDSFLVHRWVDREEQNALWARTKQIRAYQLDYQKKFKEAADKAPVIDTPNGPVKIVKVGNYPPVTVPVVLVTKKAPVAPPEEVKFRHIFGMR